VPEELALDGIADGPLVAKFIEFPTSCNIAAVNSRSTSSSG